MKKNVQLLCFSVARSLAVDLEDAVASDVAISFAATATEVLTATADPALRFVPDFLLTICPCNQGRINQMADKAKCLRRTKKKGHTKA
jgi:hypothetical protein